MPLKRRLINDEPGRGSNSVAKGQPRTHCPKCGSLMIHENTSRQLNVSGAVIPAMWMEQGYQKRARCPLCGHVVEPPT